MSVEGLNFLNAMLTYDPDDRINAKDCLKHLFFRDVVREEMVKEAPIQQLESVSSHNIPQSHDKIVPKQEIKLQPVEIQLKPVINVAKIPDTETHHAKETKIEKHHETSSLAHSTLPYIEEKHAKMQVSSVGLSTKATIFGNEFKNIKYSVHPDGVIDVAATSQHGKKSHYQTTNTLPKLQYNHSMVSSQKGASRPSYESAPLSTMSSNYHIIRKNDLEKSTFYKPRNKEDNKTLDVALARARRAVKRQNEINSGKGRLTQKGHTLGLNVVGNQKVITII
jgi:serine/threonine protein kinase